MLTQRSGTDNDGNTQGAENILSVPPAAVDLVADVEHHFDHYFGCQFEANIEPNIESNHDYIDYREYVVEEPIQRQTEGRCVQGDRPHCSAADMARISDVPENLTIIGSDNQSTWLFPDPKRIRLVK